MNLLLVNPSRLRTGHWGPGSHAHLFVLYAACRHLAPTVDVEVLDLERELGSPEDSAEIGAFLSMCRKALEAMEPDVVAISCWTSLHYTATVAFARLCRQLHHACRIVVGGYHASALPDDFRFPGSPFDAIITGEGELALVDYLEHPAGGGRVIRGRPLPSLDLPLPWDAFPYFRGSPHVPVWFSRGCPFLCTFCQDRASGWRALSPQAAIDELQRITTALPKTRVVNILDPLFGALRRWRREFLRLLADWDPDLEFWAETRADTLDPEDAEVLGHLRFRLDIGLDAVSPEMIRTLGKSARPDRYLEAFGRVDTALDRHRVPHYVYLLVNHPGETTAMLDETAAWAQGYYRDDREHWGLLSAQSYKFFPGTVTAETLEARGARVLHPTWWRDGVGPMVERAARVVSSRQKALAGAVFAHDDVLGLVHALARRHTSAGVESPGGAEPMLAAETIFSRLRTRLSEGTFAELGEQGRVALHQAERRESRVCSADVGAWVTRGFDGPLPREAPALFAGGYLAVEIPPPGEDTIPERVGVSIETALGTITARLLPEEAPRTVANFLHLVRLGVYSDLRVDRSCPRLGAWVGLLDPASPSPYALPFEAGDRPAGRGSLVMNIAEHAMRFALTRQPWPEAHAVATVFGQVLDGQDVVDRLVTGDRVIGITVV